MMSQRHIVLLGLIVFSLQSVNVHSQETLPDPDGKPADITKPVQVYILQYSFIHEPRFGRELRLSAEEMGIDGPTFRLLCRIVTA